MDIRDYVLIFCSIYIAVQLLAKLVTYGKGWLVKAVANYIMNEETEVNEDKH